MRHSALRVVAVIINTFENMDNIIVKLKLWVKEDSTPWHEISVRLSVCASLSVMVAAFYDNTFHIAERIFYSVNTSIKMVDLIENKLPRYLPHRYYVQLHEWVLNPPTQAQAQAQAQA